MSKLCLGTVQFGLEYGINNITGKPSHKDVVGILDYAVGHGVTEFDTASAYGESEEILGNYFELKMSQGLDRKSFRIMSKLPPVNLRKQDGSRLIDVKRSLMRSLKKLNLEYLDGYYLHSAEEVYDDDVLEALSQLKEEGLIKRIGISSYTMEHCFEALNCGIFDIMQIPYNILDQRFDSQDFVSRLEASDIKIYARSPFLQGLLLMDPTMLPNNLFMAKNYLQDIKACASKYHLDMVKLCILFSTSNTHIDKVVMGVDSLKQLKVNLACLAYDNRYSEAIKYLKDTIKDVDEKIILPTLWGK